ncbi:MAG: peptidoglycan-binding protein [Planctomycetota bacterium]
MVYPIVRRGSRNTYVADIQAELNQSIRPSPNLAVDGIFGRWTETAVRRFQRAGRLVADGIVGKKTHGALFGRGGNQPIFHRVRFISQPTQTTCWAASTAMMTSSDVPAVMTKTPADMWSVDVGLLNFSETDRAVVEGNRYGRVHGLKCYAPMSWTAELLRETLRRSPLMFDMLWNVNEYMAGAGSSGHMLVIAGMRGEGSSAILQLYDPWPVGRGRRSMKNYYEWMREVPTRTYRVFERKT